MKTEYEIAIGLCIIGISLCIIGFVCLRDIFDPDDLGFQLLEYVGVLLVFMAMAVFSDGNSAEKYSQQQTNEQIKLLSELPADCMLVNLTIDTGG